MYGPLSTIHFKSSTLLFKQRSFVCEIICFTLLNRNFPLKPDPTIQLFLLLFVMLLIQLISLLDNPTTMAIIHTQFSGWKRLWKKSRWKVRNSMHQEEFVSGFFRNHEYCLSQERVPPSEEKIFTSTWAFPTTLRAITRRLFSTRISSLSWTLIIQGQQETRNTTSSIWKQLIRRKTRKVWHSPMLLHHNHEH